MLTHRHDLIRLNIIVTPVVFVSVLRDGWSTEGLPSWKDVQRPVSGALCFSSGLPMRAGIRLGLSRWKGKWRHSFVSDSLRPHGLYSPWDSPGQNTGAGSLSLLQGIISNPKIEPKSPALQADSSPAELSGKPLLARMFVGKRSLLTSSWFSLCCHSCKPQLSISPQTAMRSRRSSPHVFIT